MLNDPRPVLASLKQAPEGTSFYLSEKGYPESGYLLSLSKRVCEPLLQEIRISCLTAGT